MFKAIDSKRVELDIKNSRTKYDYGKMLQELETEIRLINDNIDKMYVDKLNNKISEDMYDRLFKRLTNEVNHKEKEYNVIKNKKEDARQDDIKEIEKVVKEFLKLEKPTPECMRLIINKIEVHQNKQVDIVFNFRKLNNISNQNYLHK